MTFLQDAVLERQVRLWAQDGAALHWYLRSDWTTDRILLRIPTR